MNPRQVRARLASLHSAWHLDEVTETLTRSGGCGDVTEAVSLTGRILELSGNGHRPPVWTLIGLRWQIHLGAPRHGLTVLDFQFAREIDETVEAHDRSFRDDATDA